MARIKAFRMVEIGRILMVCGAFLAATVGSANAQGWGHGGGGPDGGVRLGVPLRALNLTADQQTQATSILTSAHSAARPIAQQLRQARSALADAMLASPTADVSAQLTAINGLQGQLLQNRVQTTAQLLGILTPDQLAHAAQVRAQLSQLRGQMRQLVAPPRP